MTDENAAMEQGGSVEELEARLDDFNPETRALALDGLCKRLRRGEVTFPQPRPMVNLHAHSFFSYNSYGYSPSHFAWLARKEALAYAGIVDFDVLDGLGEFLAAAEALGLKGVVGLETRVFIPEFSDKVINSPGEPGVAYHMGVGIPSAQLAEGPRSFLYRLRKMAEKRNRELTDRVNQYLGPARLDYDQDVLPLTPSGNATERHVCLAYARKAMTVFAQEDRCRQFWHEKLGMPLEEIELPESRALLNTIRSRTMKRGGVGYVQPGEGSFPMLHDFDQFVLEAGGIPALTWLNGLSDGEQEIERLLEIEMADGVAAVNIIPDRNFTEGVDDEKLAQLNAMIALAEQHDLPVVVGTEMNSPGQRFLDAFETPELAPHVPVFMKGAAIVYAHSALQRVMGMGYTSAWAWHHFPERSARNAFFQRIGETLQPGGESVLQDAPECPSPSWILDKLRLSNEAGGPA